MTKKEKERLKNEDVRDLKVAKAVYCKVRYFRDGAVLGIQKFLNDFSKTQEIDSVRNRETDT